MLESDPSFPCFTLDGQAIVLEDYLDARPENEGRLRALLESGRLEVGPSYVLPDELLVGAEPLVRNLLMGRAVCRRFGAEPAPVGYMPDSFGHPLQLPQILAGFGIDSFIFSRGLGDQIDEVGVVFRWRSPDGSEVRAFQQLPSYSNFDIRDADDAQAQVERHRRALRDRRSRRAGIHVVLLCDGEDHRRIRRDLPALCSELERPAARNQLHDRALARLRGCDRAERPAGVDGGAARQPAPERAPRRQLRPPLPQAGERARRAAAARGRDARGAAHRAHGRAVSRRRLQDRVAPAAQVPSARLDLRLLMRRGSPRHARPLRAARTDGVAAAAARARRFRYPRRHSRRDQPAPVPSTLPRRAARDGAGYRRARRFHRPPRRADPDGTPDRRPPARRHSDRERPASASRRRPMARSRCSTRRAAGASTACTGSRTSPTSATSTTSAPSKARAPGAPRRQRRGCSATARSSTSSRFEPRPTRHR